MWTLELIRSHFYLQEIIITNKHQCKGKNKNKTSSIKQTNQSENFNHSHCFILKSQQRKWVIDLDISIHCHQCTTVIAQYKYKNDPNLISWFYFWWKQIQISFFFCFQFLTKNSHFSSANKSDKNTFESIIKYFFKQFLFCCSVLETHFNLKSLYVIRLPKLIINLFVVHLNSRH